MRIRVLIGILVVLGVGLGARLLFSGSGSSDDGDPVRREMDKLAANKDIEGLAERAQSSDAHVASLAVSAMGRLGEVAMPEIERAMTDSRPVVREKAATAYAKATTANDRVASPQEAVKLAAMVKQDKSANVRAAAVTGLGRMDALREMDAILDAMMDPDPAVRRRAANAARRFTGVNVQYDPDASPDKRRAGAARMRAYWNANKDEAFRAYDLWVSKYRKADR